MSEPSKGSEEGTDLQMDVMPGGSDPPPMEVGRGSRETSRSPSGCRALPQVEAEDPMEEEEEGAQAPAGTGALAERRGRGGQPVRAAARDWEGEDEDEEFDDWEDDDSCGEKGQPSGAVCRVSAALEGANKRWLRSSRAREAALVSGFQMPHEKTPFEQLAFIEELFSLMVVSRLTEELGCDEMDRE